MSRTPRVDKNGLRKGPWSKDEDDKLRAYIQRYGHWNWREIPRFAGVSRCGKSCRLRWMNYLRPNIKHGNFTKEEEDLIMEIHNKIGNKWAKIAAELPGRSDNEIKNYWHTHLKKRVKNDQNDRKNTYDHETKNQTNSIDDLMESLDSGSGHDELEALWASLSEEASLVDKHEYHPCLQTLESLSSPSSSLSACDLSVEYGDGSFWTDAFFADYGGTRSFASSVSDLDAVNNVVMGQGDTDEFMWSTMDLYFE